MAALNRGVFTIVFTVLNMVLFLTMPGTYYFSIGLLVSIHVNSMLATLNSRDSIRSRLDKNHTIAGLSDLDRDASSSMASVQSALVRRIQSRVQSHGY
ncbi:hypothetical protein BDV98DRAFT_577160 [Pterulicium gracile]|uniref:DUF6534 domain-containing protein n=1 Tax=Pterulicium gracile TaxID=1884261 RepID=A0A5C3Q420_9AGAR|nr:hypothetical protein BDV98DRAFT_577160 [Pterula gracilis]